MASFVFNVSKGRAAHFLDLPGATDGLVIVPLESSGLENQATLTDKGTLSAVLAGTTNEQTSMGRKTVTTVTAGVDNSSDRYTATIPSVTWTGASGNAVGGVVICYAPDTSSGDDSTLVPITYHDWPVAPSGSDLTLTLDNFYISH